MKTQLIISDIDPILNEDSAITGWRIGYTIQHSGRSRIVYTVVSTKEASTEEAAAEIGAYKLTSSIRDIIEGINNSSAVGTRIEIDLDIEE